MSTKTIAKPAAQPTNTAADKPKTQFIFQQYQDNTGPLDPSRIDDMVTEDFSYEEWQPAWISYDRLDNAAKRYYQRVTPAEHGHLFKADAFNTTHNCIGRGYDKLHPSMGGIPEDYLHIRPREAAVEEERQMSAASARRLVDNEKLQEIRQRTNNVVGAEILGGISFNRTKWED